MAIAFDGKGHRNARRWASIRQKAKSLGTAQRGLTGAALEQAIMSFGQAFPGHVIREQVAA